MRCFHGNGLNPKIDNQKINEQMIRQMAIATALLGINDLGRPVTPTFFQKQLQFTIAYTLSKNEQKINVGS